MTDIERAEVVDRPPALAIPDEKLLTEHIQGLQGMAETDPERIADSIVARILAAETVEDVLAPQAIEHARDLIDVPITLLRGRVQQSDYDTAAGVYAVIEAEVIEDGRTTTFSCGGRNVLAQLHKLAQLDAFPVDVVIREAPRPTKAGFKPLWLEPVGPRDAVTGRVERAAIEHGG